MLKLSSSNLDLTGSAAKSGKKAESLGVRIEDVVLVTDSGYEILTKGAPRTVAEIEKVMAQGRRGAAAPAPRKP